MTDDVDLKDMVLSFAAQVARRCSEAVNGGGLAGGAMEDRIDAGGVEWSVSAAYDAGSDFVVSPAVHEHWRALAASGGAA